MSTKPGSGPASIREPRDVLGYLLKHAHHALEARSDAALAPFGMTSRDLGVLRVIAGGVASSQQDVAAAIGVDRTSMVALLDALERAGLIARRPSEDDRRRNVIGLTARGATVFAEAERASLAVEKDFAAVLGDRGARELRRGLKALIGSAANDS